jgi:mannan endo-1,4-beta-mannosidase
MRRAQKMLAGFAGLIDWPRFRRVNLNEEVRISRGHVHAFACGDDRQAVVWLVRSDTIDEAGMLSGGAAPVHVRLRLPGLAPGSYRIVPWDTVAGSRERAIQAHTDGAGLAFEAPFFTADLALAITPAGA